MTTRLQSPLRVAIVLFAGIVLSACFDPPVQERLTLRFLPGELVEVELLVELRRSEGMTNSEALTRRLETLEEDLLGGWDPWSARFADLRPEEETFRWRKVEGRLSSLQRTAKLSASTALGRLFGDVPVEPFYQVTDGVAELAFYAGAGDRASRRERRLVDSTLERWSLVLAQYFERAEALYRYLEKEPDRAAACFAALFEEEDGATHEEEALLSALGEALAEAWFVLEVDRATGESLQEVSRRVLDPFPADVVVEVAGREVLEVEGFEMAEVGEEPAWRIPAVGFWEGLMALEGRWLAPDPLLAFVAHERSASDEPFPVAAFASKPRLVASPPEPEEVSAALRDELTPRDVYRLHWRD